MEMLPHVRGVATQDRIFNVGHIRCWVYLEIVGMVAAHCFGSIWRPILDMKRSMAADPYLVFATDPYLVLDTFDVDSADTENKYTSRGARPQHVYSVCTGLCH